MLIFGFANSAFPSQGQGFSKAMTAPEAQAFVGDEPCVVTILEYDKLFLVAPSSPPKSTSRRHRRDTSSEAMELMVRCSFLFCTSFSLLLHFTKSNVSPFSADKVRTRRV